MCDSEESVLSSPLDDSVLSLLWVTGLRKDNDTFELVNNIVGYAFMDGYDFLFLDDDIGVFNESRIIVNKRRLPVPFNEVRNIMLSRRMFIEADKNNVSIDDIMSSDVFKGIVSSDDYIDVTHSIALCSGHDANLNLGAAVRLAELLSSGVYKAGLLGQDAAKILTSLPKFDRSLIQLVMFPEEFAIQALLARL